MGVAVEAEIARTWDVRLCWVTVTCRREQGEWVAGGTLGYRNSSLLESRAKVNENEASGLN
jgi:hypothetical protein